MSVTIPLAMISIRIAGTVGIARTARIIVVTYSGVASSEYWGKLSVTEKEETLMKEEF